MVIDLAHFKMQEYVSSPGERRQLSQFLTCVNSAQDLELVINLETLKGSKFCQMTLLQMVEDTLYLTDIHESMVIIDLDLVKSISIVR